MPLVVTRFDSPSGRNASGGQVRRLAPWKQRATWIAYLPRPGFFRYLKKSELGSSTSTSLFVRKLLR